MISLSPRWKIGVHLAGWVPLDDSDSDEVSPDGGNVSGATDEQNSSSDVEWWLLLAVGFCDLVSIGGSWFSQQLSICSTILINQVSPARPKKWFLKGPLASSMRMCVSTQTFDLWYWPMGGQRKRKGKALSMPFNAPCHQCYIVSTRFESTFSFWIGDALWH